MSFFSKNIFVSVIVFFCLPLTGTSQKPCLDSTEKLLIGVWRIDSLKNKELVVGYNGEGGLKAKEIDKTDTNWYIQYKIIYRLEQKQIEGGTGYLMVQTKCSDNKLIGHKYQNCFQIRTIEGDILILYLINGVSPLKSNVFRLTRIGGKL